MRLRKWENLPPEMQTEEVRKYYDILKKKRASLFFKRLFDICVSLVLLIVLSPIFLVLSIAIKTDSKGPVFYRQTRVTQYNREFRIFKFRSMVQGADKGSQVTVENDVRVTRVGKLIRYTPTGDKEKDVQIITQQCISALEKMIREEPLQWLWAPRHWLDINRRQAPLYKNWKPPVQP